LDKNFITSAPLPVGPTSKAFINDRSDGAKPSTTLEHEVTTSLHFCRESQQFWVLSKILLGTPDRAYIPVRSPFYIQVGDSIAMFVLKTGFRIFPVMTANVLATRTSEQSPNQFDNS